MDIYNNLKEIQKYCSEHNHQFNIEELARLTTKERDILKYIEEYDKRVEQILLGNMIVEPVAIRDVTAVLKADDFDTAIHKKIYQAILNSYSESNKAIINSVKRELESMGELEQIGGFEYLVDLVEIGSTDSNLKKYIEYIKDRTTI
ncbi:replicative DNA helicase [Clostridium sp. CAG:798]|nr:replicative DNA helicase [Clostridium sp. CAG:798]